MSSFIHDVLQDLQKQEVDFSQITFILPSKRAGVFLRHELASITSSTIFSPEIKSIEEFVEELSQLKQLSNTELLFEFYSVYTDLTDKTQIEPFDEFSKWAQILIQDFNEIDRYLTPSESIFDYLSAIQDINHWSLDKNQTPLIKNYLSFWQKLNTYYTAYYEALVKKGVGYQGLIYREAVENLESYIQFNTDRQHVFLGFNALNSSESSILEEFLQSGLAQIYWDIDETFLNNMSHDAGYFIRQHKTKWQYFKQNDLKWAHNYYSREKNITAVGIPKNIGQAKYVGELLSKLKKEKQTLSNTAVVLSDETLLLPVLNSLPNTLDSLNITMGFPLRSIPLASLFDQLFLLHKNNDTSYYYKDVVAIISHPSIRPLFIDHNNDSAETIIESIYKNNLVFLKLDNLIKLSPASGNTLSLLFKSWNNNPQEALNNSLSLIIQVKAILDKDKSQNLLALEYLYRFHEVFNILNQLCLKYNHLSSIEALYSLYNEILKNETLDFQGEPLKGLQIMGMLESRVLDFETVIITSVNEGILPSGKSHNSFIPFDVKIENALPTYKEKDAVYAYHFYKLIQRAKNVYILYNTEPDVINGGEKSRFITQLEIENIHTIKQEIVTPKTPKISSSLDTIIKTEDVLGSLKSLAEQGLSPSALTNYIRNPLDFYYQKVLGIKDFEDVEETIAAKTLGTVIHNTLEDFYKPLENQFLSIEAIDFMVSQIESTVLHHFKDIYKEGDITKGKNLIIYEIAKRYILNFLNREKDDLKKENQIKVKQIEANLSTTIQIEQIPFPVTIKGKVDRVDEYNGTLRIIDYKTGKVEQNKVEIVTWESITTDYTKYSKSFQVLMYAYMMNAVTPFVNPVEAGIISFKNLNSGFMKFGKKESSHSRKKDILITSETLKSFEIELKKLISEIYNPNIPFVEKEI